MRLGSYRFHPGLWPTLVVLLLLPVLLSLGAWQLDRAAQKRALLASLEAGQTAGPVDLNRQQPDYGAVAHRRVTASGRYDAERQILIDNQIRDGRAGYQVLTPLRLAGSDVAVLVDRGWLAAPADRRRLPDLSLELTMVRIRGVLDRGPAVGLRLGAAGTGEDWPRRIQYLDYGYLNDELPYRVLPYLIRLAPETPQGYRRDWHPVPEMGPEKHVGYAVQWFALAVTLLAIYVVVNLKRNPGDARE